MAQPGACMGGLPWAPDAWKGPSDGAGLIPEDARSPLPAWGFTRTGAGVQWKCRQKPRASVVQGDASAHPFPLLQVNIGHIGFVSTLCPWGSLGSPACPPLPKQWRGTGGACWLLLALGSMGRCRVHPWEESCPWA